MLNLEVPINSLSFGQMGWGVCYEIYKRGLDVNLFPHGEVDLRSFKEDRNFSYWLDSNIRNGLSRYSVDDPVVSLWHINGSHRGLKVPQSTLWTAHETSESTPTEINILSKYSRVLFTSNYSKNIFEKDCNADWCPNFFDEVHLIPEKKTSGPITFGLVGKLEKRKNTRDIMISWANLFAGKKDYRLNCCIYNPFIDGGAQMQEIARWFNGRIPWNINILPFQVKNSDFNKVLNSIDIDLSGLSGAEGWGLPCFNAICMEKVAVVLNAHAHKDYANEENSILVEPNGVSSIADGVFFQDGAPFNQGNMFTFSQEAAHEAYKKALDKLEKGVSVEAAAVVREKFSVRKTVDKLLNL